MDHELAYKLFEQFHEAINLAMEKNEKNLGIPMVMSSAVNALALTISHIISCLKDDKSKKAVIKNVCNQIADAINDTGEYKRKMHVKMD